MKLKIFNYFPIRITYLGAGSGEYMCITNFNPTGPWKCAVICRSYALKQELIFYETLTSSVSFTKIGDYQNKMWSRNTLFLTAIEIYALETSNSDP